MRFQMRQNNVEFLNRKLPTNILALLLVTTRRDTQRHQEQTPLKQSNILARLLVQEQTAIAPLLAATPKVAA